MHQIGTKTIETPRLILRPLRPEDAEAMYRNWASDPRVTEFLTWPPHGSPEVSRRVLEDCAHGMPGGTISNGAWSSRGWGRSSAAFLR